MLSDAISKHLILESMYPCGWIPYPSEYASHTIRYWSIPKTFLSSSAIDKVFPGNYSDSLGNLASPITEFLMFMKVLFNGYFLNSFIYENFEDIENF